MSIYIYIQEYVGFRALRVKVLNNWVLGMLVLVPAVQLSGKPMIVGYLDP